MQEHIVIIGAGQAALDAVLLHQAANPDSKATALYPELNPLPEFSCSTMERYLGLGIEFPERLRACGIDRKAKKVHVRDAVSGVDSTIVYDKLVLASGSAPGDLDVLGEVPGRIFRSGGYADAKRLKPRDGKTVVIGTGLNMLLTVSALLRHEKGSIEVIPVDASNAHSPLSDQLTHMVRHHLTESGVIFHEDVSLESIESTACGLILTTSQGDISAVRVVNATSCRPVTYFVAETGLETDRHGNVVVDADLRTSDPNIFACGDCASFISEICKMPIPGATIKSSARRQTQTLARSLAGESLPFTALPLAWSVGLGDLTVAGAGLNVDTAKACGFDKAMSATAIQFDRAHFMPEVTLMTLELVFDADTRRVLGIHGISTTGDALCGRISAVSALLASKPDVDDIANLEVAYSPPFASAMDIINTVANVADNMLAGVNEGISAAEFEAMWAERDSDKYFFLDCRELGNARQFIERHPDYWNHIPQGEVADRISEVPDDRKIILLCNTGARSYEAQVVLKHAGREDVVNVDGGMTAVRQSGVKV